MKPEARHFVALRRRGLNVAGGTGRVLRAAVDAATDMGPRSFAGDLVLLGPGDVAGIEPSRIARRWPAPGSVDARAGTMPYLEFTDDDMPWALSDLGTSTRLRPWLALVVVEEDEDAVLSPARTPLPVLTLRHAAHSRLHAAADGWAHAHVEARPGAVPDGGVPGDKASALSRLLSPRRLEGGRRWIAALVPATEAGRLRGLGRDPGEARGEAFGPAAASLPGETLELPAYDTWRFSTSLLPRFEDVVKRLRPHVAAAETVWAEAEFATAQTIGVPRVPIRSALRAPGTPVPLPSAATRARLAALTGDADAIGPPLWGARHAPASATVPWRDEINHDPALRMAAGHGARIVRERQEELARAAWDHAGEVEAANLLLARGRAAVAAARRSHGAVAAQHPHAVLAVLAPLMARTARRGGISYAEAMAGTPVGDAAMPAARVALRRAARARGGARGPAGGLPSAAAAVADRHGAGFVPRGRPILDFGAGLDARPRYLPPEAVAEIEDLAQFLEMRFDGIDLDARPPARLGDALRRVVDGPAAYMEPRAVPALDTAALAKEILRAVDPAIAIPARIRPLVSGLPDRPGDPLGPVRLEPPLPFPLVEALAAISPALVAPALAEMPPDSATLLELDAPFCEALFAGANHELMRELLWRRFPGDLSMSPLRRMFPDQRVEGTGAGPGAANGSAPRDRDTPPMTEWRGPAGSHILGAPGTVILLRTPLFRIFPKVIAFLAPAEWEDGRNGTRRPERRLGAFDAGAVKVGRIRGALPPDAAYMGFDLSPGALAGARGGAAGYYLVFHGPRDENTFGFDAPDPGRAPSGAADDLRWDEAGWTEAVPTMDAAAMVRAAGRFGVAPTGAGVAAIASERAFTYAVHLSDLVEA